MSVFIVTGVRFFFLIRDWLSCLSCLQAFYHRLARIIYLWASLLVQLVKEYVCNAGDPGSIPGSERSPGEGMGDPLQYSWASLVAQSVKNPSAMRETWVQSLAWEDPLEGGMATHFSIPAWRISMTEVPSGFQSIELQRVRHDWATEHTQIIHLASQKSNWESGVF